MGGLIHLGQQHRTLEHIIVSNQGGGVGLGWSWDSTWIPLTINFPLKGLPATRYVHNVFIITQCRLTYMSSYVSNYIGLHGIVTRI